ncbi:MAG: protein kinase [Lentisphaeria bacterium]|jgi:serine/threonine protein kinase|nr:protein kinase [Lentisphaeria bacterium]
MRFQCSSCGRIVAVDDVDAGIMVQCGHCGSVVQVPPTRLSRGSVIADFIIRRAIGQGGMGTVYLSHQITLDRPAALKILAESYANNAEFVALFIKEARAAAKLNHPHIVQAYAVGEDDGLLYFAMENIDGETMKDVLDREGAIPVDQALNVIQQIAEALNYAWIEQKLIHCDIKPDNIMLTSTGRAKLADLGLARVTGDMSDSDDDEVMGTPQYISPEALTGAPMDTRSDIYSLGATFYQFVTGRLAFDGATAAEIAKKHLTEPLIPPRSVNKDIPESVSRIIMKMMAKNPSMRYQDASELIDDLRNARRGKLAGPATDSEILAGGAKQAARVARPVGGGTVLASGADHQNDRARNIYNLKKRQQDEARKTRIVVMIACLVLLVSLVAAGILFYFNNAKAREERARKEAAEAAERELQRDTPMTLEVDEILAFSRANPSDKRGLLEKCEAFIAKNYQPSKPKEDQALMTFRAVFQEVDESMMASTRDLEARKLRKLIAQRRDDAEAAEEARRRAQQAAEDKRKADEYAQQADQLRKEQSARTAMELAERLVTDKEYFAGHMIEQTRHDHLDRAEKDYADWFQTLDRHAQDSDEAVAEVARPYRDWARIVLDNIAGAKAIRENTYNGNTILAETQVGYGPSGICRVKSINNGVVKAVMVDGKQFQFNFDDLPLKQRLVLLKKGAGEAGHSDALYFYLLLYGDFAGAKEIVADDDNAKEIANYILASYFKYVVKNSDEKTLEELKAKYGTMREFRNAMSTYKQNNP